MIGRIKKYIYLKKDYWGSVFDCGASSKLNFQPPPPMLLSSFGILSIIGSSSFLTISSILMLLSSPSPSSSGLLFSSSSDIVKKTRKSHKYIDYLLNFDVFLTRFRNKIFMLGEMTQWNSPKFAIVLFIDLVFSFFSIVCRLCPSLFGQRPGSKVT